PLPANMSRNRPPGTENWMILNAASLTRSSVGRTLSPDGGASRRPRKLPDITRKALALPAPLSRLDFDCIYYTLFFPHFQ
ncbi:MAG: hypothetical protein U0L86_01950, partial [Alistipes finegoldii]|nr:hypothetical protein [Alistipes finegoldii]